MFLNEKIVPKTNFASSSALRPLDCGCASGTPLAWGSFEEEPGRGVHLFLYMHSAYRAYQLLSGIWKVKDKEKGPTMAIKNVKGVDHHTDTIGKRSMEARV